MEDTVCRTGSRGERELQELHGSTGRAERFYDQQVLDHLNEKMRAFVRAQEMVFVATAAADGHCDSTFRAGPPGFLQVLDERTIAYPEYRGNGVMASLGNVRENAHIGLLLIDFFTDVIGLHINGRAEIVENAEMLSTYADLEIDPAPGRRPERWVKVTVHEAYIHCSKHIPRLARVPRTRHWGTDDVKRKGGDYFEAKSTAKLSEQ